MATTSHAQQVNGFIPGWMLWVPYFGAFRHTMSLSLSLSLSIYICFLCWLYINVRFHKHTKLFKYIYLHKSVCDWILENREGIETVLARDKMLACKKFSNFFGLLFWLLILWMFWSFIWKRSISGSTTVCCFSSLILLVNF